MADNVRTISTEQILADAELAATFFRSVLAKEIPLTAALSLTQSYLQSMVLSRMSSERPKDPWDGG